MISVLCGNFRPFGKDQIEITKEHESILEDPKSIIPAAFVSFKSRWGAAVCAQTLQSNNPTLWLTDWAPEPRDVYWKNMEVPVVCLSIRRYVIIFLMLGLGIFVMVPIAFVQALTNVNNFPFLDHAKSLKFVKSLLQGVISSLTLKLFLFILTYFATIMSKMEGHVARSVIERKTAEKLYNYVFLSVFLGSLVVGGIVTGTGLRPLGDIFNKPFINTLRSIGEKTPKQAYFFITYIMLDGWSGVAGEISRLFPLVRFHVKRMWMKTKRDKEKATDPGTVGLPVILMRLHLYFLIGSVYATTMPILLPFLFMFFGFGFFVYRHQMINVYTQKYESAAAFWPDVQSRIVAGLLASQLILMGYLSTQEVAKSTPLIIPLLIFTILFHFFCKNRFKPAFRKYPIDEAKAKDTAEQNSEAYMNWETDISDAYLHPAFKAVKEVPLRAIRIDEPQSHAGSLPTQSGSPSQSLPQFDITALIQLTQVPSARPSVPSSSSRPQYRHGEESEIVEEVDERTHVSTASQSEPSSSTQSQYRHGGESEIVEEVDERTHVSTASQSQSQYRHGEESEIVEEVDEQTHVSTASQSEPSSSTQSQYRHGDESEIVEEVDERTHVSTASQSGPTETSRQQYRDVESDDIVELDQ